MKHLLNSPSPPLQKEIKVEEDVFMKVFSPHAVTEVGTWWTDSIAYYNVSASKFLRKLNVSESEKWWPTGFRFVSIEKISHSSSAFFRS